MSLRIDVRKLPAPPGAVRVALAGNLDATTSPELETALAPLLETARHLIFDLAELKFISSAGVRVLVVARKELKAKDGTFAMQNLQPQIQKVFEIIGSLPGVTIFRSQQELDAYLAAIQEKVARSHGS